MSEATKTVSAEARKLSPAERIELIDDILSSLDEPDAEIDRLWAKEAEERLAAYRRGEELLDDDLEGRGYPGVAGLDLKLRERCQGAPAGIAARAY